MPILAPLPLAGWAAESAPPWLPMAPALQAGRWQTALQLFEEMQHEGCAPNTVTYNSLIMACGQGECSGDSGFGLLLTLGRFLLHVSGEPPPVQSWPAPG